MSEEIDARLRIPDDLRPPVRRPVLDRLVEEVWWFLRAFGWSLLGAAIVSFAYLFLMGLRFLESSDAPVRSYSVWEYVLAPFATIFNPFGFVVMTGWATMALLPARLLVRHRHLGRCTLFSAAVVSVSIVIGLQIGRWLLSLVGLFYVLLPFAVLCAALLLCRYWPGRFFEPRFTSSSSR